MKNIIALVIVLWLVVGGVAAWQRGYFGDEREVNCKSTGDTVLTVLAGPLNYFGVNPKVDCDVSIPQPSE
ncbi:MAG: hypothetical protein WBP61_02765 [Nocardioides sp.]